MSQRIQNCWRARAQRRQEILGLLIANYRSIGAAICIPWSRRLSRLLRFWSSVRHP